MPATWDPQFRPRFYERWGRENAIISAMTRSIEYPEFRQLLSIKAASNGVEEYLVDGRRIPVDDDTFLILNGGRTYGSRVHAIDSVHSFTIFFRPGLLEDVLRALTLAVPQLLEEPASPGAAPIEFAERLHPHDGSISPVLRHIHRAVAGGHTDDLWIEEQLHFLLQRMLRLHDRELAAEAAVPSARPATRKELYRRLGLGLTFLHTHFRAAIDLDAIAAAARMSRFHFLRTFKAVHGVTPSVYLNAKRTRVAMRLLATTSMSVTAIADEVGFGGRTTLFRHLKAAGHVDEGRRRMSERQSTSAAVASTARAPRKRGAAHRAAGQSDSCLSPAGWFG